MTKGIGFVGIGIMGEGMAARLLTQKIAGTQESPLYIWNRTQSKCDEFKKNLGEDYHIIIKDSAKEVVEACDVTYCMVSSTPSVVH
jgi:3-hydroxyisobutyrate dehydrogenase/glyoxylate/succinic semialdehyde reductase